MSMHEQRRIRFATIEGIDRSDLPLAAEVWQEDLKRQEWVTRDMLKLATSFTRYMADPRPELITFNNLEGACQMDAEQTPTALRLMQIYGAVEAFSRDGNKLKVSLNLCLLHRLRVLEARHRFAELRSRATRDETPFSASTEDKWLPQCPAADLDQENSIDDLLSDL